MTEIIDFVYGAMVGGSIGNATYDGIKLALGDGFDTMKKHIESKNREHFGVALEMLIESNRKIKEKLEKIKSGDTTILNQQHNGTGDNVGRDKIVNITQNGDKNIGHIEEIDTFNN